MQAVGQGFVPQHAHRRWVGVLVHLQSQTWKAEMGEPRSQPSSKTRLAEPYQQNLGLNERPCLKENKIESNQRKSLALLSGLCRPLQSPADIYVHLHTGINTYQTFAHCMYAPLPTCIAKEGQGRSEVPSLMLTPSSAMMFVYKPQLLVWLL